MPAERPDRAALAASISLPETAIRDAWFAGLGPRFAVARLTNPDAVARAQLDRAAWRRVMAGAWANNLYLFAGDTDPGGRLVVRMFGPALGVDEDPATGSGAAALAGVLAERRPEAEGRFEWEIEQGAAVGRPSRIAIAAEKRDGAVVNVQAGGPVVIVAEGTMRRVE